MDWMEHVAQVPLQWLLEPENPSVRARALTELLDRDAGDEAVVEARQAIADAPYTAQILAGQHPDGHWGAPEGYFRKHTGTAWRWLLLHELGLDPMHPQMLKAADCLLDIAHNEARGGFGSQPGLDPVPCYNGWLLWGLYRSGYGEDARVRSALRWVIDTMRFSRRRAAGRARRAQQVGHPARADCAQTLVQSVSHACQLILEESEQ